MSRPLEKLAAYPDPRLGVAAAGRRGLDLHDEGRVRAGFIAYLGLASGVVGGVEPGAPASGAGGMAELSEPGIGALDGGLTAVSVEPAGGVVVLESPPMAERLELFIAIRWAWDALRYALSWV